MEKGRYVPLSLSPVSREQAAVVEEGHRQLAGWRAGLVPPFVTERNAPSRNWPIAAPPPVRH